MGDLSRNFSTDEFRCKCCNEVILTDGLVDGLQKLRDTTQEPIHIISAYRCAKHNKEVGGAKNSYHIYGSAADIASNIDLDKLYFASQSILQFGGIGLYPDNGFIHVDIRPYSARWGRIGKEYTTIQKAKERLNELRQS